MLDGWPIDSPSRALADVEDMLGLLVTWPTWARELILKKGLSNEERNTLTWFALGNRLPPLTLARYLHLNGSLNDERAYKDIVRKFRLFLTGTNDKNFLYWDLGDKQLKPVGTAPLSAMQSSGSRLSFSSNMAPESLRRRLHRHLYRLLPSRRLRKTASRGTVLRLCSACRRLLPSRRLRGTASRGTVLPLSSACRRVASRCESLPNHQSVSHAGHLT